MKKYIVMISCLMTLMFAQFGGDVKIGAAYSWPSIGMVDNRPVAMFSGGVHFDESPSLLYLEAGVDYWRKSISTNDPYQNTSIFWLFSVPISIGLNYKQFRVGGGFEVFNTWGSSYHPYADTSDVNESDSKNFSGYHFFGQIYFPLSKLLKFTITPKYKIQNLNKTEPSINANTISLSVGLAIY